MKLFANAAKKMATNPKLTGFAGKMKGMNTGLGKMNSFSQLKAPSFGSSASLMAAPVAPIGPVGPVINPGSVQAYTADGTPVVLRCSLPWMTYMMFATIVFLLIGVIALVASQKKCAEDKNSSSCKSHYNFGVTCIVLCSILLVVFIILKFRG